MPDPDAAGRTALGATADFNSSLVKLAIDTPRAVLIQTINALIETFNKTYGVLPYSKSTDAAGYNVTDYGIFKRYTRTLSGSVAVASGQRTTLGTVPVPTGRVYTDFRIFVSWEGSYSGHCTPGAEAGSASGWQINLGNEYSGGTLTMAGKVHVLLEEINP